MIPLANDLRNLEQWLRELEVRIGLLNPREPIATTPGGNPNATLARHAHTHAPLATHNLISGAGTDPLQPYDMQWDRTHTWAPVGAALTPITITLAASQTADALTINANDGTRIFTVNNVNAVGINENLPLAHLVVQAAGISEADILALSPILWLDASDSNLLDNTGLVDGDGITTWSDKSGAGHHSPSLVDGTHPTRPKLYTTTVGANHPATLPNHMPVISTNVTGSTAAWDELSGTAGGGSAIALSDFTMVAVVPIVLDSSGNGVLLGSTPELPYPLGSRGAGMGVFFDSFYRHRAFQRTNQTAYDAGPVTYPGGTWQRMTFRRSGGAYTFYVNNALIPTAATSGSQTELQHVCALQHSWVQSGPAGSLGATYYSGPIAEMLLFADDLSDDDLAKVWSYLDSRYYDGVEYVASSSSGGGLAYVQTWQDATGAIQAQINSSFRMGLQTAPAARLHVLDTVEPLRLAYSASIYESTSISATTGVVTRDAVGGSTPLFAFADSIRLNAQKELRFADADTSNYVGFKGGATITSNLIWTLPLVDATAAGHPLKSDAAGTLSFGVLGPTAGGTGQTTVVTGDLLYGSAADTWSRRAIGTAGDILTVSGGLPTWVSLSTAGIVPTTRTLTAGAGLTGGGDLSADRTFDVGAGLGITVNANDVAITLGAANRVLGINSAATNVEYKDVVGVANEIDVTHTANTITIGIVDPLIVAKGGTGIANGTSGGIPYFSSTTTIASSNVLSSDALVVGGGAGSSPATLTIGTANQVLGMASSGTSHEYKTISGVANETNVTHGPNSITIGIVDPLIVAKGGTGLATLTANNLIVGAGTSAVTFIAPSTSGNILQSNGTVFQSVSLATAGIQPLDADLTEIAAVANVRGDMLVTNSGPTWVALTKGAAGTVIRAGANDPAYSTFTIPDTFVTGDLVHASATNVLTSLADIATGNVLLSGGVGAVPTYGKVGLTTHVSGTLAIGSGGTGQTTALAAFNALSPLTTRGDLLTRDASNNIRLAVGTASTLLKSDGTDPSWGTVNLLSAFHGDTTAGTVARGDIITGQTASPTWKRLAVGASATILRSDGTDAAWVSLATAGIVGGAGTPNTVAKFTATGTIGDSDLTNPAQGTYILKWDSSNHLDVSVGSTGGVIFDAVGTSTEITYGITCPVSAGVNSARTNGSMVLFTGTPVFNITKAVLSVSAASVGAGSSGYDIQRWYDTNLTTLLAYVDTAGKGVFTDLDTSTTNTWTLGQTFTAESVHNGGVDLSTSGRLNSQVADGASAIGFLIKPTNALPTAGAQVLQIQDSAGNIILGCSEAPTSGGSVGINTAGSASANQGILQVGQRTTNTQSSALLFTASTQWGGFSTYAGIANSVAGIGVLTQTSSSASNTGAVLGAGITVAGTPVNRGLSDYWGIAMQVGWTTGGTIGGTVTDGGGIKITGSNTGGNAATATNWYGILVKGDNTRPTTITNQYGIYIDERTKGATIKAGILAASATAGYKCYAIGDVNSWLAWESSSSFSLNSTTVLCKANLDISAKNIATDTTTGTKIGTGTTQKLGFWNATPVARPAAYTTSNVTTDRTVNADSTTLDEVVDVLCTLIGDLQSIGLIG